MRKNILSDYKYEAICVSDKEFLLSYKNNYYRIAKPVYDILTAALNAENLREIQQKLLGKYSFEERELEELIRLKIVPVFQKGVQAADNKADAFWLKFKLIDEKIVSKIAGCFSFAFGRFFYLFFFLAIAFNLYLFVNYSTVFTSFPIQNFGVDSIIISYLLLFGIIFLHELGHAGAACKLGIKPRNIGLGFYTILPVMYTDLTDAWRLDKWSKIKINLGGIFHQLLISIILLLLVVNIPDSYIKEQLIKILLINKTIVFINLFPLMKFDGYWILSDFTGISNLLGESNKWLKSFFIKKGPFENDDKSNFSFWQNVLIKLYSLLRVAFIVMVVIIVFSFVFYSISKILLFVSMIPYMKMDLVFVGELLKRLLLFFILYIFSRKYVRLVKSIIFKKKR